jgi:hypothetical protein
VEVDYDKNKCRFTVSCGILISFVVTRCSPVKNHDYWNVYFPPNLPAHFYVVARLRPDNDETLDYFIFSKGVLPNHRVTLGAVNSAKWEAHRFDDLSSLAWTLRHTRVDDLTTNCFTDGPESKEVSEAKTLSPHLSDLQETLKVLFRDENFATLLRAEEVDEIPDVVRHATSSPREQLLASTVIDCYVTRMLRDERIRRYITNYHFHLLDHLEQVPPRSDKSITAPVTSKTLSSTPVQLSIG